jgi:hypothetical protein
MTNKNIVIGISSVIALVVVAMVFFYNPFGNSIMENSNQVVNPAPQGKLNIDAVCRGVLAYMTFPDSASAELYVEECKEGKHPAVIERYRAEMGLSDDVAI